LVPSLDQQAAESLAYIRHTMARSASFTAVPGWGGIGMGVVAVIAATVGAKQSDDMTWLAIWLGAAAVAVPVGVVAMIAKAQRHAVPLWSPAGRRFAQAFLPALLAAAILTVLLVRDGRFELLPPIWLLLYGAGVMAGAASSVPVLSLIGIAFIVCGAGAAVTAPAWGNLWLGTGFGALHIVFGFVIARKHGG
jgi:hypothetical protein